MGIGTCTDRTYPPYLQGESSSSASAERRDNADVALETFEEFGRLCKIDKALEVAEEIPPGKAKWNAFLRVSRALAGDGYVKEALCILKMIPDHFFIRSDLVSDELLKHHLLEGIFIALEISGKFSEAIEIPVAFFYQEGKLSLAHLKSCLEAYLDTLEDLATLGRVDKASEAVMKMFDIIEVIDSEYYNKQILSKNENNFRRI